MGIAIVTFAGFAVFFWGGGVVFLYHTTRFSSKDFDS